jgi:phospholipid transport system substrate-binding protein
MIESLRRGFAAIAMVAAILFGASGARADEAAEAASAQTFIRTLADQALVYVNSKTMSDAERSAGFRKLFVEAFDIPDIGRFVLGRHWKSASADQQQDFLKAFEEFTVLTWSTRFKDYSGVSLVVDGASPADEGYFLVESHIVRLQGEPLPVGWRAHKVDAKWKITDILIENVSMALTQRQDFASVIQSSGGTVDGLLTTMHKKIDELRAGQAH